MSAIQQQKRRLFFALWPGAAERAALAAWLPPLRELCGGRSMRPDTLHLTLVFLGEVAEHRLQAACLAAQEVVFHRFDLQLATAHYWGHNHIVYATPTAVPAPLAALAGGLAHGLRRHGFHFEERPYKPHVTLLRNAKWSDADLPSLPVVHWPVYDFALVQSLPGAQSAHYEVLARFDRDSKGG